ncbi:hypothetical protein D9M68_849570 [compost metagenome]
MADKPMHAATQFQADFRQLGGLARSGFTGDHHHLVFGDGGLDLVALGGDRQGIVVTHRRHAQPARFDPGHRCLETLQPLRQLGLVRRTLLAQLMQLPAQAVTVDQQGLVEVFQQVVERSIRIGHQAAWAFAAKGGIVADFPRQRPRHDGCALAT